MEHSPYQAGELLSQPPEPTPRADAGFVRKSRTKPAETSIRTKPRAAQEKQSRIAGKKDGDV